MNTPVLLITFNRPEHTRKVLEAIMVAQPKDLYVFQDGAREGNETDLVNCPKVREVVQSLVGGTETKLHTYYSDRNLGCGPGPFAAISWFFQHVEMGIIMEDDIIPHELFFPFMENMLQRYSDNSRIGIVAGHNFFRKYSLFNSYYFTFDTEGTLGWGTWRRVWKGMDFDIEVKEREFNDALKHSYKMPKPYRQREYEHFRDVLGVGRHDRWDYQLEYYLKLNGFINIKPNSCLTSHEGNDANATHSGYDSPNYKMEVNERLFTRIMHPLCVHIDFLEKLRVFKRTMKLLLH